MKLETRDLKIAGANEGQIIDFSQVKSIEQLKHTLVENCVPICRECYSEEVFKFRNSAEPVCPLLEKIVCNYVDMNIKSVNTANRWDLSEFIKSAMLLIDVFSDFITWQGLYTDERFNWYFEGAHPSINSNSAHQLLRKISEFLCAYRVVETSRLMKFSVLVEGDSEYRSLPPILEALGALGASGDSKNKIRFINMEGTGSLQVKKIRDNLKKYREDGISYFLVVDNDPNVLNLIENLIDAKHYLIWEHKFEDNFPEEAILHVLDEVRGIPSNIDIDELKRYNSTKHDVAKSIEHFMRHKGISFSFDDYKVGIAERLSSWICREIDESMRSGGTYIGSRIPKSASFPQLVEKLRGIAEEMKRESTEFYVVKGQENQT